ncbi:MAG TPA: Crp/Fnr family transcriptional regulator [Caulobacterales bacterium]|nr:Crp/Fnr family transcriptional regulator [Caulobacterales bacterium]
MKRMEQTTRSLNSSALVLRRLSAFAELKSEEQDHLASALRPPRSIASGEKLGQGAFFVASGWLARQRTLRDGRRQVVLINLPGDGVHCSRRARALSDADAVAMTRVEIVPAEGLIDDLASLGYEGLARALSCAELQEDGLLLDQIVRLGRQTAYERTAHLLLELYHRLAVVGLAANGRMPLPLTQEQLADVLGLSIVHMNRIMQALRRDRKIELAHGALTLLAADELTASCDFSLRSFGLGRRPA